MLLFLEMKGELQMKKFMSLLLALTLIVGVSTMGVLADENTGYTDSHTISIDGEITKNLEEQQEPIEESPQLRSVYYIGDYIKNTLEAKYNGYDRYFKHFYNTSVSIPADTTYTFEWFTTVEDTSSSSHDFNAGLQASGKVLVAELEGHFDYTYNKSSTVKVLAGTKTSIGLVKAGEREIDWYFKAKKYNLFVDWKTINDVTGEIKTVQRRVGIVYEATEFLHVEVTN